MKELKEIQKKHDGLVRQFEKERSKTCYENMGNKYLQKFDDFIGDVWDHGYFIRQEIFTLRSSLLNIVTS